MHTTIVNALSLLMTAVHVINTAWLSMYTQDTGITVIYKNDNASTWLYKFHLLLSQARTVRRVATKELQCACNWEGAEETEWYGLHAFCCGNNMQIVGCCGNKTHLMIMITVWWIVDGCCVKFSSVKLCAMQLDPKLAYQLHHACTTCTWLCCNTIAWCCITLVHHSWGWTGQWKGKQA